jgi:hypothetical protein
MQQWVAELMVFEDAIESHACLQSIQQWGAEFMGLFEDAIASHALLLVLVLLPLLVPMLVLLLGLKRKHWCSTNMPLLSCSNKYCHQFCPHTLQGSRTLSV